MLHILFLILKIIGIILLVILGIVILLLCTVLFVPVRYQVEAVSEGDKEHMRAKVKVSWFLRLISAFVEFDGKQLQWKVRIFWKTITQETLNQREEKTDEISEKVSVDDTPKGNTQVEREVSEETRAEETREENVQEEQSEANSDSPHKRTWYEKIKYTFQTICDKIKACYEIKEKVMAFLKNEIHQQAFSKIKKELFWLLKKLRPKQIKGKVRFGFDDPCTTGQVLAGLSVLYPFYGENIEIEPEFEHEILAGDLFIKGHIRVITFVIVVWRLIWSRQIRATYKAIKNWKR